MDTYKVKIQNLKCGGCANTIETTLKKIEVVKSVQISTEDNTVSVEFNQEVDQVKLQEVNQALKKMGYPVMGQHNLITDKAKSYFSCAIGRLAK